MTPGRRLVIFDVDGTLVDSQAHIVTSMTRAFVTVARPVPPREAILSIVGLSLPVAIARLDPGLDPVQLDHAVLAYKAAFAQAREASDFVPSPLYDGACDTLEMLKGDEGLILGIATGKSRRGLLHVLASTGLADCFATVQVADDHPSKPHPSMILSALAETGISPASAVMVGDTVFDVEMARAAGVRSIGVSWGYHPQEDLERAGASAIVRRFDDLGPALDAVWREAA